MNVDENRSTNLTNEYESGEIEETKNSETNDKRKGHDINKRDTKTKSTCLAYTYILKLKNNNFY